MQENQAEKHPHIPARRVIDRIVLGGSDGAIEGVSLTAALDGAALGSRTILLAGLAFAVAGGLSMFFSSYLSSRSELNSLRIDIQREKMEIETEPEEERKELEELLKSEGYAQKEVDVIMGRLLKDKAMWLREQLRRELRLHVEDLQEDLLSKPAAAGLAFVGLALFAVTPYGLVQGRLVAVASSLVLTLTALFVLSSRAFIPRNFNPKAGLESVLIGSFAASVLFILGLAVSTL